ncbi:MAG: T9SS type A sorting domain-containing protein [Rubricoccaceae bacterium]
MRSVFLAAALLTALAPAGPARAQVAATNLTCVTNTTGTPTSANGSIRWPAANPVWEFDFYRPANRTTGQGTGLEIRNVRYLGRKVFERASVPVLNVEYDPGSGCSCYRDWQYTESRFVADGVVPSASCIAEATPGAVQTNCERGSPIADAGSFNGVAIEDYGDELVLTAHMSAGWYRYRMRWHFYADGRLWPEYAFAASSNVCTSAARRHHAYWRFDFDLDGSPNTDVVMEHDAAGQTLTFTQEASRTWRQPEDGVYWSVRDSESGAGFTIVPSADDLATPVDAYSKTDFLVLRYKADEIDDGLTIGTGCAFMFEPWVNRESLEGQDVVVWYRSSTSRPVGPSFCKLSGPMLTPFGYAGVSLEPPAPVADVAELQAAFPNPFTPYSTVRFRVAETQEVRLVLFDARGRALRTLFSGLAEAGSYESVPIDGAGLPAGTYLVRLEGAGFSRTTQVVIAR